MGEPAGDPRGRSALPVACTLGPDDGPARMARWQRLHERAAPVARVLGGRLEVRYRPAPGVHEELTELAAAEQACCAFATWRVSLDEGRPVLHVIAPPGAPDAIAPIAALFR